VRFSPVYVISCIANQVKHGYCSFCWNIRSANGKTEICDNQNASGETRLILLTCAATIELFLRPPIGVSGAGRTRWLEEDLEQDLQ
jgi:hypothetical protein